MECVTLIHEWGLMAKVPNLGATLTEPWALDRTGRPGNVVLDFDRIDGYLGQHPAWDVLRLPCSVTARQ